MDLIISTLSCLKTGRKIRKGLLESPLNKLKPDRRIGRTAFGKVLTMM